ncbi:centrosomal protein of 164 kDa-like isoform X1 [Gambusia affinis]|uniref:centrosomal protein of 164 kDa-like isoform X1 n=1 Tax=Gambusia affinis TaxID=33528 RepID=UPI001CDBA60A|nr:centrosomal protein of 164 kDa-like isoform X1 [Gambusia affinis]XP_043974798.1 centrosomal protein of 164 kDa-like isoform X1 [Gambusia affinis]
MTAAALIGDQLILEEDYDESYIPSEQEIHEYAREIGIDPDNEPELLWLAREGIVAPLPPEWKPCQDVTGDIYYFNFSTGQSTWDHPCDEHYRRLVVQERKRTPLTGAAGGGGAKKDKKKKKEKKEKKEKRKKEPLKTPAAPSSSLGPLPSPLRALAPLRGLDILGQGPLSGSVTSARGSLGSSGGLEPLKTSFPGPRSSGTASVLGSRKEERVSLSLHGLHDDDDDGDDDDEKISDNELSPRGSDRLLKNLHLDLDALGGGLQYEESEASGATPAEERTEPELQDLGLSGDHSPEPPSHQDSLNGRHIQLSAKAGSRSRASEEGAEHFLAEGSEEEVEEGEDVQKVDGDDVKEGIVKKAEEDKTGNENNDGTKREKQDNLSQEKEREEVEELQIGSTEREHEELEEGACVGKDEAKQVSESTGRSSGRDEKKSNEVLEGDVETQNGEGKNRQEKTESNKSEKNVEEENRGEEEAEEPEIEDEIVEECFSALDGNGSEKLRKSDGNRGEIERNIDDDDDDDDDDESQNECEKEEEEKNHTRGQEGDEDDEEDEGESGGALGGCSISHRKLTETPEEELEMFVQSEGEGTSKEGVDIEDESEGRAPAGESESEEEVVEVFRARPSPAQPAGQGQKTPSSLPAEESEANKNVAEVFSSLDLKLSQKVQDIKDLSGTISLLEKDEREETGDVEGKESRGKTKTEASKSPALPEVKVEPMAHKVDRLVLHQSSHSLSSSSDLELRSPKHPKTQNLAVTLGLQRPETSRGRPGRTVDAPVENTEPSSKRQESSLEEEPNWKTRTEREREEEEEEKMREERSVRLKREEMEREQERLRKEFEQELEKERERLLKEKEARMRLLQEELRREEKEEEEKLREESKNKLRELQQNLLSERRKEEARLKEEADKTLEELRQSAREEGERQQQKVREESEAMLKESHVALEEERAATRDRLEAQKKQDMERLKAESEEELEAMRKRLEREREEKLKTLKEEVNSSERRRELIVSPRPEQQLAEYHRELSDVLQEVRDEVQREHERKLEQLKDDHRREMNTVREKYLDEETAQRERLLHTLQEDRARLQASHDLQLDRLRLQLDGQIQKTQLAHSRKESELRDLADKLELREKELQSLEVLLQTKAADLNRKRKKLGEDEEDLDRQLEAFPRLVRERDQLSEELQRLREEVAQARELSHRAREERDEAQDQRDRMREERDKARVENRTAREDRERLERKVALLQERCDRLTRRVSELEQTQDGSTLPQSEQNKKKEENATAPCDDRIDSSLHVDELDSPLSPAADSQCSINELRQYVSSHGASIQKTKQFLEQESSRLMERQAALRAAQTGSSQGPGFRGPSEERMRSIQQEARDVAELQRTVQRGNSLLRRKEEQLQQLESSMADEAMFEDSSRLPDRKVTFDVTGSDISSSAAEPQDGTGDHPTVPAKVQELAESLQHISAQLDSVLTALGSLTQRDSSPLYASFSMPLPQRFGTEAWGPAPASAPVFPQGPGLAPSSLAPPLSERLWSGSAAPPLFSTPISSGLIAPGDLMNSRWSQIFPGAAADPLASSAVRTGPSYPSYTPVSQHSRSHQVMQKSVELDGQRLQGLIDSNKKWLNMRRKDPSIPLFTRYRAASSNGLVQLGLDDNNQIRVYHY